jgi:hypothetical protein
VGDPTGGFGASVGLRVGDPGGGVGRRVGRLVDGARVGKPGKADTGDFVGEVGDGGSVGILCSVAKNRPSHFM